MRLTPRDLCFFLLLYAATIFVVVRLFPLELSQPREIVKVTTVEVVTNHTINHDANDAISHETKRAAQHPLVQLFSAQPTFSVMCGIFFLVVIVAPISEEFLWRGVIQRVCVRWEYAISRRKFFLRRTLLLKTLKKMRGLISVLVVAILFAALHLHSANTSMSIESLWRSLVVACFSQTLFVVLGIFYLIKTKRLTRQSISRTLVFFRKDARRAATWWWIIPLVFGVQLLLITFFPDTQFPPIPLFPLAVALGVLALQTNRIAASIFLHATFNATSFLMMLASCTH